MQEYYMKLTPEQRLSRTGGGEGLMVVYQSPDEIIEDINAVFASLKKTRDELTLAQRRLIQIANCRDCLTNEIQQAFRKYELILTAGTMH